MRIKKEDNQQYENFVDTLKMLAINVETLSEFEIEEYLEELESDIVTFLHENTYSFLESKSLINQSQIILVKRIKQMINELDQSYWSNTAFRTDPKWQKIRDSSNQLLLDLE